MDRLHVLGVQGPRLLCTCVLSLWWSWGRRLQLHFNETLGLAQLSFNERSLLGLHHKQESHGLVK